MNRKYKNKKRSLKGNMFWNGSGLNIYNKDNPEQMLNSSPNMVGHLLGTPIPSSLNSPVGDYMAPKSNSASLDNRFREFLGGNGSPISNPTEGGFSAVSQGIITATGALGLGNQFASNLKVPGIQEQDFRSGTKGDLINKAQTFEGYDANTTNTFKEYGSGALTGASTGAALGSVVPGVGTVVGGVLGAGLGAVTGGISSIFGNKKRRRAKRRAERRAIDSMNTQNTNINANLISQALGSEYALGGALGNSYAYGGDFSNGVVSFETGGTHEENPYGGIMQGMGENGEPNLVEEGEVKWNDYIFSDRMTVGDKEVEEFNLPKSLIGKSFAKAAEFLQKESKERPVDPISKRGLNTNLSRLATIQETMREDPNNLFAEGGKLTRLNKLIETPASKELIPGGKATKEFRNKSNEDVDPFELRLGIKVEMEHTNDPKKSREIALDHLIEKEDYYTRLYGTGIADEDITSSEKEEIKNRFGEIPEDSLDMELAMGGYLFKDKNFALGGALSNHGDSINGLTTRNVNILKNGGNTKNKKIENLSNALKKQGFSSEQIDTFITIAQGESGFNPNARRSDFDISKGSGDFGALQFNRDTWGKEFPEFFENDNWKDLDQQANLAKQIYDKYGYGPWMGAKGDNQWGRGLSLAQRQDPNNLNKFRGVGSISSSKNNVLPPDEVGDDLKDLGLNRVPKVRVNPTQRTTSVDTDLNQQQPQYLVDNSSSNSSNTKRTRGDNLRLAPLLTNAGLTLGAMSASPDRIALGRIGPSTLGSRMRYNPIDNEYIANQMKQQGANAYRGVIDTAGGNRAIAREGVLSLNRSSQDAIGDALFKGREYNDEKLRNVTAFNRDTDMFNISNDFQSQQFNVGQSNQERLWNKQANASKRNAVRQGIATIGTTLGQIGTENRWMDVAENIGLGYNSRGNYKQGKERVLNNGGTLKVWKKRIK